MCLEINRCFVSWYTIPVVYVLLVLCSTIKLYTIWGMKWLGMFGSTTPAGWWLWSDGPHAEVPQRGSAKSKTDVHSTTVYPINRNTCPNRMK